MSKVVFDISISLDGFITGPDQTADEPLGRAGERLHEWAFNDEQGKEMLTAAVAETGAIVTGRRTYDDSIRWWSADSGWQFISEGLVDEISLHVVPILLGGGTRLFG